MLDQMTLLITGGTGSFGNAVLRKFLQTGVREIRILSRDEKKQDEMRRRYSNPKLKFYIGDVRDYSSIKDAFRGVDLVFHAAALKQVPSCEFFPIEAVRTNVLGSDNVISACIASQVRKAIFLSTDKAAYPINAMGMSKAIMEKNVIARSRSIEGTHGPVLCITRYGNVMASRGSVIPLFAEQISHGGPITLTYPQMTRFLMTLEDAVELVLFAFERGAQGEMFIQKAPACTLETLAEAMMDYTNTRVEKNIIGIRHGEKIFETLVTKEEMARALDLGAYFKIVPDSRDMNYEAFFSKGDERIRAAEEYNSNNTERLDKAGVVRVLKRLGTLEEQA